MVGPGMTYWTWLGLPFLSFPIGRPKGRLNGPECVVWSEGGTMRLRGGHVPGKVLLFIILVLVLVAPPALADEYSARTHYYAVEYLKPTAGTGDLTTLNVIFNRQLDPAIAERILREELKRAVTLFPPKGDIMAWAWSESDPKPGSPEAIELPDGSGFVICSRSAKLVQTEKQYDVARTRPAQPGKRIDVELALEFARGDDGRAQIVGKTNLPDSMPLMLSLRNAAAKYFAQD